jgi:hypothetical protein
MILTVIFSFTAGGSRRPSGDRDGRKLSADRIIKSAFRRYIICQRCARRYLMEFDKIFHCTRSEGNIFYFYYTARKYLYLFISGFFLNILINLQFKADRFAAGSVFITESVIIQLARDFNFRIRCAGKEIRGVLLSEIKDLFSLENILHLLFHAVRRGVKLFAEMINFFLIFINIRVIC